MDSILIFYVNRIYRIIRIIFSLHHFPDESEET
jgi:hypothetical protein